MTKDPTEQRGKSYGQDRAFRGIEQFAIRRRLARAQALLHRLQIKEPNKNLQVLELGCGYWGSNLVALHQHFPHIEFTGVDLAVSKENSDIQLIQADLAFWQPTQKYNGLLSLAVAEHLIEPATHFQLIANSLASGGMAGLTTPTPQSHAVLAILARLNIFDRDEIADHKLYYTETGLRRLAETTGLIVESYESFSLGMNQWLLLRKP